MMVLASMLAVTTRNIMRATVYLLFVLFGTAGIYFILHYTFLGAVQVTVYAGGIIVLFVFILIINLTFAWLKGRGERKASLDLLYCVKSRAIGRSEYLFVAKQRDCSFAA